MRRKRMKRPECEDLAFSVFNNLVFHGMCVIIGAEDQRPEETGRLFSGAREPAAF